MSANALQKPAGIDHSAASKKAREIMRRFSERLTNRHQIELSEAQKYIIAWRTSMGVTLRESSKAYGDESPVTEVYREQYRMIREGAKPIFALGCGQA